MLQDLYIVRISNSQESPLIVEHGKYNAFSLANWVLFQVDT